jgi:plastocyanin
MYVRRTKLMLMLLLAVASLMVTVTPVAEARRTWTVLGGPWGPKDFSVVSNAFHPRTIDVAVGDTVTWQVRGFHTVSFLSGQQPLALEVREGDKTYFNPQVFFPSGGRTYDGTGYRNSGAPPEPPKPFTYSLTFAKAGTYKYLCQVHGPAMSGAVTVKERVTTSPAAVSRRSRSDLAATLRAGRTAWANFKTERQGSTVIVPLIGDPKAGFSILRFSPKPLVISPGTTITWTMRDPFEIHTVTFLGGQKPPEFVIVEPQKQGPPKLLVNPKAAAPTKTKTYDGVGYVNSGILFPPGVPGNPPTSFSLTFTKPGRYEYLCVIHNLEGMKGTVIVK